MIQVIQYISEFLKTEIKSYRPISGGDISNAFLLETSSETLFLKVNATPQAHEMFLTEKLGLEVISNTKTIATPNVILCDRVENDAFLLMEFIESKRPNHTDFLEFGEQLAHLHQTTTENFGWEQDNFIGTLPQSNKKRADWVTFYLEERIFPQLELAQNRKLMTSDDIPDHQKMYQVCEDIFGENKPSLLHGDLWSGNFLISTDGKPYLIDPAVYFGDSEADIAMTKLFGGFAERFYEAYYQTITPKSNHTERVDLYQLYHLLVHQNIFGKSYYSSCKSILKRYFL